MNGTQTIEVRWFYSGSLPDEVINWFDALGENRAKPDARSDFYLQSNAPDLGVKLRQGNLEVKYRQQQLGNIEIEQFPESQVEQWSKWICQEVPSSGAEKQGWIQVDKIRYQRFYQVEFLDRIQLISIDTPRQNTAAIEITDLQLPGQFWWTIACEYLGNNISIDRQLLPLVRSLLLKYPLSMSTPSISCSYPQWLSENNENLSISTD
jgi:hypothetical protein